MLEPLLIALAAANLLVLAGDLVYNLARASVSLLGLR